MDPKTMGRSFGMFLIGAILVTTAMNVAEAKDKKVETGLAVGDKAPDFEAIGNDGKKHRLSTYWKKKFVVMAFNRGHW